MLLVSYFSFQQILSQYKRIKINNALPAYTDRYIVSNKDLGAKVKPRIILFGDSRIEQWQPNLQIDGYKVINRGISGETTAQMRFRFIQDVILLKPDLIIVQAGINDLVAASISPEYKKIIYKNTLQNLQWFVTEARKHQISVIFISIIHPAEPSIFRKIIWSNSIHQMVNSVNGDIEKSIRKGSYFLNANKLLNVIENKLPTEFAKDTLHFKTGTYVLLNQSIKKIIEEREEKNAF